MSNAVITNETLTLIANAIRMKSGTSGTMKPSQMPSAIAAIPSSGGNMNTVLLWTNSSPSSTFAAQTVSVNLSNYDAIIIESKASSAKSNTFPSFRTPTSGYPYNQVYQNRIFVNKNESGDILFGSDIRYPSSTGSPASSVTHRSVTISDSGVTFGNGYADGTWTDYAAIPLKIYGVSGTLPT